MEHCQARAWVRPAQGPGGGSITPMDGWIDGWMARVPALRACMASVAHAAWGGLPNNLGTTGWVSTSACRHGYYGGLIVLPHQNDVSARA
eukprot:XP_001702671.1 predicted protein [Chlamydomonas reinhardtii]